MQKWLNVLWKKTPEQLIPQMARSLMIWIQITFIAIENLIVCFCLSWISWSILMSLTFCDNNNNGHFYSRMTSTSSIKGHRWRAVISSFSVPELKHGVQIAETPLGKPAAARINLLAASTVLWTSASSLASAGLTSTRSKPRRQPVSWTISTRVIPSRRVMPPLTRKQHGDGQ